MELKSVKAGILWISGVLAAGSCLGAELANDMIKVKADKGGAGVILSAGGPSGAQRATISIAPAGGTQGAAISSARTVRSDDGEDVIRIEVGDAVADLALGTGPFVTVKPGRKAVNLIVKADTRYTVLPDFFADDTVFDAATVKSSSFVVPAENFLLQPVEGGDAMVMCIWPKAKPAAAAGTEASEPEVRLNLTGDGAARRIGSTSIQFPGQPVYVALIEQKGGWHDECVTTWQAYRPRVLSWKAPFKAQWRADFAVAEGKQMNDWHSRNQSFDFRPQPAPQPGKPKEHLGSWQEHIVDTMLYPAVFDGADAVLCLYADKQVRRAAFGPTYKPGANSTNFPPSVYDRVIIYPLGRDKDTPLQAFTPVDLMRMTLGQGPCEYVLDVAGIKGRGAGAGRPLLDDSTCGLWDRHIFPIVSEKMRNMKPGDKLDSATRDHLLHALEDMWFFVKAVHDRIREYKAWGTETAGWLKAESEKSAKIKPGADKALAIINQMNADIGRFKFEGPGTEAYWKTRLQELQDMTKEEKYTFKDIDSVHRIRDLGNSQDELVSRCRQYVKTLRQEMMLMDSSDAEVRQFAAAVRSRCQQILRNSHPKECL